MITELGLDFSAQMATAGGWLLAAADHAAEATHGVTPFSPPVDGSALSWAGWILWLPLISLVLCGACSFFKVKTKLPAWITVALLGAAFALTLSLFFKYTEPVTIPLLRWFDLAWGEGTNAGAFVADFGLYVDKLTLLWMLFVTGLGTLIALYASEYMEPDVGRGYARFFAGVSVFLFAMGALVMGDNLVTLYLGWEGVGFASYWLIGYYYERPSAVAAAKKAFIVNRIGDLGLALGLYLTYHYFDSITYADIFANVQSTPADAEAGGWPVKAIPFLLMLAAFGKSAQLPLYVWLPDAMEGPTPVSALIHAATMVTAGVYLLARMMPVMELNAYALPTVAWIGGLTSLLAATIAMAQYDIKRIMAYSTVSQLGYMFMGLGVLTSFGGVYHVFTHAFFKAVLFLTCGAIMHGFAGQLDLRKLSGLRHIPGWRIVSWTMFYGCLCLIGFPFITSGFLSKDLIIAQAFITKGPGFVALGCLGLFTALLTGYYTFRVWFRVCAGPVSYEMGDEHHGDDHADGGEAHDENGHDEPHAPRLAINLVLVLISLGAILSIFLKDWVGGMVDGSTARLGLHEEHHPGFWHDPHRWVPLVASLGAVLSLSVAWYLHLGRREAADGLRDRLIANPLVGWIPRAMENKWYVDEFYHGLLRAPLWVLGIAFGFVDKYFVDLVIVDGIGKLPRAFARMFQPLYNGMLHSYAVSMAGGIGLVILLVMYMPEIVTFLRATLAGGGAQ